MKDIQNHPDFIAFRNHVEGAVSLLNQCVDIPDEWTAEQKAVELTARKRASEILHKVLEPLQLQPEPNNTAAREKYGL
jgi:hypothetical protein